MPLPSRGLDSHQYGSYCNISDNEQPALICKSVQTRAGASVGLVAFDVGMIFIVERLRRFSFHIATRKESLEDLGNGKMHGG